MGLVILPIYIGALVIYINSIRQVVIWLKNDNLDSATILFGILISLFILFGIGISYYLKKRVYALSPAFRIPFWLIYIPGIIGHLMISRNIELKNIEQSLFISIIFSGILILIFHKKIFGILDYLKVEQYY